MTKYFIKKSNNGIDWIIWKEVILDKSFCGGAIFSGTRSECFTKLKEIRGDIK